MSRRRQNEVSGPPMTTRARLKRNKLSINNNESEKDLDEECLVKEFVMVNKSDVNGIPGLPSAKNGDWKLESDKEYETELKKHKIQYIVLLFFLYFLQGLPLGLTGAVPFLMSSNKISYSDQGTFSFAFWPFSIKLLW